MSPIRNPNQGGGGGVRNITIHTRSKQNSLDLVWGTESGYLDADLELSHVAGFLGRGCETQKSDQIGSKVAA